MKIHKTISANIPNFSSRLSVPFEKAISEAVVNSIQANATNIDVKILYYDTGTIKRVEIIDNGDGFTDKNIDAFFDLHSDHKKEQGGKGIGRVSWFKYFDTVNVKSTFEIGPKYSSVLFSVASGRKGSDIEINEISAAPANVTSVTMTDFRGDALIVCEAEQLKHYFIKEMALMLFKKYEKNVKIKIVIEISDDNSVSSRATIEDSDIPTIVKKFTFEISFENNTHMFILNCIKLKTSFKNNVSTGFVAGERTLSNFSDALGITVHAPIAQFTGQYWLLLEAELFNKGRFSTEGRDRILIPDGKNLYGDDIKSQLKAEVSRCIVEFYDDIAPDFLTQRKAIIDEIEELYPQYANPVYKEHINGILVSTMGRIFKHDLLKKLNDVDFDKEYRVKQDLVKLLKKKPVDEKIVDATVDIARRTSEQAKNSLANYFWYRSIIIDQLQKYVEDNERSEDLLHTLFFRRFATEVQYSLENCIWLLDDKFMRFSYFASEAIVKNVVGDLYGEIDDIFYSQKRMDLFIKYDRPEGKEGCDCVVVEFKGLGATVDEKADAASQVRRKYAKSIRQRIPQVNNIFVYIITQIDEELRDNLLSDDFKHAYTRHGYIMTYYNIENRAYISFLSASVIIGDAKDRHEHFFDILKGNLSGNSVEDKLLAKSRAVLQ